MTEFDFALLGRRVLCAVSGGADSVYLLHRCVEGAAAHGFSVCAAHYNHCLRGDESERDERFVRELCASLGVELRVGRGDVAAYAAEHGMGTEEAARTLRYAFLESAADEMGCDTIATAHNADDNAETMLFALARGSGPRGLTGIPPRRGRIVRPMLGITRRKIEAYLNAHGIEHVEDSTNKSLDYTRNRIRALVMPVLREINPGFAAAAHRAGALLRADEEYLEGLARDFLASQQRSGVDCAALTAQPWSVAARVVRMMSPRSLELRHVESVLAAAASGNAAADVPGGRFMAERGRLRFVTAAPETIPDRVVNVPGDTPIPEAGIVLRAEFVDIPGEIHTSLKIFYFQCEDICGTMNCTARRAGDKMRVKGRGCTKKLADLMAERNIPASRRGLVPVLRDSSGVLAAVGFGQDERTLPRGGGRLIKVSAVKIADAEGKFYE